MFVDSHSVYELTNFSRVCFPIENHPWPDLKLSVREVVRDKHILQCGGAADDSVKISCYYLDPDQGQWVRSSSMMFGRKQGSSSLYGEEDDILITGGKNNNDKPHDSAEIIINGR